MPTQKEREDSIIAIMLLELELSRRDNFSDDKEYADETVKIVRKHLPDIYIALKRRKNELKW